MMFHTDDQDADIDAVIDEDDEEGHEPEEPELEEEEEEDYDPANAANAYFAAQHRRASRSKYAKKPFAELPGGEPQELTEAVHKLLEAPPALSEPIRRLFAPQYPEWLSLLHAGFSVLLHGVGSKKELIDDFTSGFNKSDAPVVVLQGYSSGARVRDLLLTLLTQVLRVPQPPTGSTRALCKQLRQAFAAAAPPLAPSPNGVDQLVLRLLPSPKNQDIAAAAAASARSGAAMPASSSAATAAAGGGERTRPVGAASADAPTAVSTLAFSPEAEAEASSVSAASSAAAATGALGTVGLADGAEEAEEATAEAEAAVRSEAILTPSGHGATKRERRMNPRSSSRKRPMISPDESDSAGPQAEDTALLPPVPLMMDETGGETSPAELVSSELLPSPADASPADVAPPRSAYQLRARNMRDAEEAGDDAFDVGGRINGGVASAGSISAPAHVYVVVHAIDSAALRGEESQALLAELARIPQIHLLASCSNRYASLLWDARKARAFNWAWREAATMSHYTHEATDSIHELGIARIWQSICFFGL